MKFASGLFYAAELCTVNKAQYIYFTVIIKIYILYSYCCVSIVKQTYTSYAVRTHLDAVFLCRFRNFVSYSLLTFDAELIEKHILCALQPWKCRTHACSLVHFRSDCNRWYLSGRCIQISHEKLGTINIF